MRFDLKNKLPSFGKIQCVGWIVYFIVIYITFLTIAQPNNYLNLFFLKGFRAFTGFVLTSLFLRPIYRHYRKKLSISQMIILALGCSVIFGMLWTAIEAAYSYTTAVFNTANYLARSPRIALDYAMTLTAWSALYIGIKNWLQWQTERENALQSAALTQKAQLEMLRYQLNPHFLFNSLNSIRASVNEDSNLAQGMITKLSEFLRYSLLSESHKTVSLREELDAVENYLAIEKIRFEEKLEINFEIEEAANDLKVPYFLLNPLIENAVKHGFLTSEKPLRITISAKVAGNKLRLEVKNSGKISENSENNGTKIGLKNVRERLNTQYGENATFDIKEDNGFVVAQIEILDEA